MSEVEKVTNKAIEDGGVLINFYMDLHGSSEEIIKNTGTGFVQKIIKEKGVVYAVGKIMEPIKNDDVYSTTLELKILTKDFVSLAELCASYSPFSIDILKPDSMKFGIDKMHDILMFISTTTMTYKKHILNKMSSKEDQEKYQKHMKNRADLGKKLRGSKHE